MNRYLFIALVSALVVLLVTYSTRGDLYTDGVLSLDWRVDSADEIHHVRFVIPETPDGAYVEPIKVYKPRSGKTALDLEDLARLRPAETKRPSERILFINLDEDNKPIVVRRINLDNPMDYYRTAAFTTEGKPIRERDAILKAVEARVQLGRKLPPNCHPFVIADLLKYTGDRQHHAPPTDPFEGKNPLAYYIGGKLVKIDCNDWDYDYVGPDCPDTWICVMVLPIEPEDHERLIAAALKGNTPKGTPQYCHPVACLVNFPGEKTEACLREIANDRSPDRTHDARTAWHVLSYFHYRTKTDDPLSEKLVGRWRLNGRRERIDIQLAADGSFTAEAADFDQHPYTRENPRRTWQGKGYWVVRDGKMSLMRTDGKYWNRDSWYEAIREIFRDKTILKIAETEVDLENGPPMTRLE